MSMRRITITILSEILESAAAEAARAQVSVSAWLSSAAAHAVRPAEGRAAAAEVLAEIGEPTEEEREEIRGVFDRARTRQTGAARSTSVA